MKFTNILIVILYLAAFGVGGYFFYKKYFNQVVTPPPKNEIVSYLPGKTIYYTSDNSLFQLNSDLTNKIAQDATNYRFQQTGKVNSVEISSKDNLLIYDVLTPDLIGEIWQVNLQDNSAEKLFSSQTPGLEKYSNFRNPRFSRDFKRLAFLADNLNESQIFTWEFSTRSLINISHDSFIGKINDLSWDKTANIIYFVGLNEPNYVLYSIDMAKTQKKLWEGTQAISSLSPLKDKIIVLFGDKDSVNLGYLSLADLSKITPITDLVGPKKVLNYSLSKNSNRLVYQVQDLSSKTNDIYIVNADGTNLLQLTTDGKAEYPVISPDELKVVFWATNTGIYTISPDKKDKNKLLNSTDLIDKIISWN